MKDLVCGMEVSETTQFQSEYIGKRYYFCSSTCKSQFDQRPGKYKNRK